MNLYIFIIFVSLLLLLMNSKKSVREHFTINNRLYKALNVSPDKRKLFDNYIGDNIMDKMGKKIISAEVLKDKYYYPKTFIINKKDDFPTKQYLKKNNINFDKIWYVKEAYDTGGGSEVHPEIGYKDIKNKTNEMLNKFNKGILVQENIEPYLINNKKTDVRIFYIMVLYRGKVYFYLQNDGFLKVSNKNYNNKINDKRVLITNTSFQKNTKNSNILISTRNEKDKMMDNMFKAHKDMSNEIEKRFNKNYNSKYKIEYQVSGSDWIFDNKLNPYLLEHNPVSPGYLNKKDSEGSKMLKNNLRKFCEYIINIGTDDKELPKEKYGFIML